MDDLIRRVRIDAFTECAWLDAADPARGAGLREIFGGGEAETFETVEARLGTGTAEAWPQCVDARKRFFEAVREYGECDHEFEWDTAAEAFLCLNCGKEAPADFRQESGLDIGSGEPC